MNTSHLSSPAESHRKGPHPEEHESPIRARVQTIEYSLKFAEPIVAAGRARKPEMASRVLTMYRSSYPAKAAIQQQVEAPKPHPVEEATQPNILKDEDNNMNPIMLQAYVDQMAKSIQETNDDIQKAA